jgi:hypothetical protein
LVDFKMLSASEFDKARSSVMAELNATSAGQNIGKVYLLPFDPRPGVMQGVRNPFWGFPGRYNCLNYPASVDIPLIPGAENGIIGKVMGGL